MDAKGWAEVGVSVGIVVGTLYAVIVTVVKHGRTKLADLEKLFPAAVAAPALPAVAAPPALSQDMRIAQLRADLEAVESQLQRLKWRYVDLEEVAGRQRLEIERLTNALLDERKHVADTQDRMLRAFDSGLTQIDEHPPPKGRPGRSQSKTRR